ncbi:MAG: elongation factor Ts [Methyloligella sp.]|nr:MAG: elongation factor Ts [Methyloligella sp.]
MAEITASMVKELRETTGAGMMDCKAALKEADGNLEQAIDWLRTKGLAKAAKKAGRVAAEGLVGIKTSGTQGVVVEVNSETDFVARNDQFQEIVAKIGDVALEKGIDDLANVEFPGKDMSIEDYIKEMVGTIGENMSYRRGAQLSVENGAVAGYIHNATVPGLGKIGVLVALETTGDAAKAESLGKQIAMHIAAINPLSATVEDLDPAVVEREKAVLTEQARESGKPDNIIEKMIEGRIRKFYEEVVLLKQVFVIDGENTVEKAIKNAESDIGAPVEFKGFVRFELGEGIEVEESDFAAEVAATAGV